MSEWQQTDYVYLTGSVLMLLLFFANNYLAKKNIANLEEVITILQRGIEWRDDALVRLAAEMKPQEYVPPGTGGDE